MPAQGLSEPGCSQGFLPVLAGDKRRRPGLTVASMKEQRLAGRVPLGNPVLTEPLADPRRQVDGPASLSAISDNYLLPAFLSFSSSPSIRDTDPLISSTDMDIS